MRRVSETFDCLYLLQTFQDFRQIWQTSVTCKHEQKGFKMTGLALLLNHLSKRILQCPSNSHQRHFALVWVQSSFYTCRICVWAADARSTLFFAQSLKIHHQKGTTTSKTLLNSANHVHLHPSSNVNEKVGILFAVPPAPDNFAPTLPQIPYNSAKKSHSKFDPKNLVQNCFLIFSVCFTRRVKCVVF